MINTDGLSQEEEIKIKSTHAHATVMVADYHLIMAIVEHEIGASVDDDDFHDILQVILERAC